MKWFGEIMFSNQSETEPGIVEDHPIVRAYMGDVIRNSKRDQLDGQINSNITMSNQLSIIADPYLMNNFQDILCVTFNGSKWRINTVEVKPPRLLLSFGSLYKEDTDEG